MKDHFLSSFLRALPFGPRGRRIVDETLHDWDHELVSAHHSRWFVAARGIAGIVRAVAFATAVDLLHVPIGWLFGRLMLFAVMPAAVLVLVSVPFADPRETFTFAQSLWIRVLTMPLLIQGLLPIAFFLAMAWPAVRRPTSVVGIAVVAVLATFVTTAWLAPAAREYSSHYWFQLWQVDHPDAQFVRFDAPLSIAGLVRKAWADGVVVGQLPFIVGLPVMAAAFVCAGFRVPVGRGVWQRVRLLTVVPVYFGALSLLGGSTQLPYGTSITSNRAPFELAVRLFFVAVASAWILWRLRHGSWRTMAALLVGGAVFLSLPNDWWHLYSVLLGGYAPWFLAAIALAFAWRAAPAAGSRSAAGELSERVSERDADERTRRPDTALMWAGRSQRRSAAPRST